MSGGGERSEREGASERASEGGREGGGKVGEAGGWGEEGRRPAPPIAGSCKRAPGAFLGARRCVRAPFCSSRGGGGGPRGRRGGGRGPAAGRPGGGVPPQNRLQRARGCRSRPPAPRSKPLVPGLSERAGLLGRAAVASGRRCPRRGAWAHHAPEGPGCRAQADPRLAPASTRSD